MRSYNQYCAVAKALDVIGDRWTHSHRPGAAGPGGCRYTDLQYGLPGIATNLLSQRLRELEDHGLVRREAAPPPVATTLYDLTDAGRELEPVLRALGRWGVRFMPDPTGGRGIPKPLARLPGVGVPPRRRARRPPAVIEVRTGDQSAVIEMGGGEIGIRLGSVPSPDLVLEGDGPTVLGVLTGMLKLPDARKLGLRTEGSTAVLRRLQPQVPR